MKKNPGLRSGSFPSARKAIRGTREISAPNSGTCSTRVSIRAKSIRVFPLSNWTELDIWHYILGENIPVVPLYFAKERPVVRRSGTWIMVDDDRLPLEPGEKPEMRRVRFRTLGCYPLTGAIESDAATLEAIVAEMKTVRISERQGRLIDSRRGGFDGKKEARGLFLMDTGLSDGGSSGGCAKGSSSIHHLRLGGRRQVDAHRATAARIQAHLRGSARGLGQRFCPSRDNRRRHRFRTAGRRSGGGTRAGHHHRRRLSILRHVQTFVHCRGYTRS